MVACARVNQFRAQHQPHAIIDIPEPLYKRVKIRAEERGQSLRDLVLTSLEREFAEPDRVAEPQASYRANRKLLPEYEAARLIRRIRLACRCA